MHNPKNTYKPNLLNFNSNVIKLQEKVNQRNLISCNVKRRHRFAADVLASRMQTKLSSNCELLPHSVNFPNQTSQSLIEPLNQHMFCSSNCVKFEILYISSINFFCFQGTKHLEISIP